MSTYSFLYFFSIVTRPLLILDAYTNALLWIYASMELFSWIAHIFFQVLLSCAWCWSGLHEFMHHSIACMLKFFILLFQGLTILWCISFFNLAFEFLETHAQRWSFLNQTTQPQKVWFVLYISIHVCILTLVVYSIISFLSFIC